MEQDWESSSFVKINKNLIRLEEFALALKKEDAALWGEFAIFFDYFATIPHYSIEECNNLQEVLNDSTAQLSSLIEYLQKRQQVTKTCLNTKILCNIALDTRTSIYAHININNFDESFFA